jgi:hypothetical protein
VKKRELVFQFEQLEDGNIEFFADPKTVTPGRGGGRGGYCSIKLINKRQNAELYRSSKYRERRCA